MIRQASVQFGRMPVNIDIKLEHLIVQLDDEYNV
jgi:hypothetical protein